MVPLRTVERFESVILQMKEIGRYFAVVMFVMLYKVALNYESMVRILSVTIQTKVTKQYFPVVLFMAVQGDSNV